MPALKTWALTFVTWVAMATLAQADPLPVQWDWSAWMAGTPMREGTANFLDSPSLKAARFSTQPASTSISTQPASTSGGTQAALMSAPASPPPPAAPSSPTPPAPTSSSPSDAFLNFGASPYPEQSVLTVGTAQPWYTSGTVTNVFGHTPTPQEQQSFIHTVAANVQHTFAASGLTGGNTVSLTTDPGATAHHTMSVVSGLSYGPNPNAIGITDVGANGFSFIDKLSYAKTPQELAWAVAHNVSHELMHAFGVGVHHDETGSYLDAGTADWSLLTNPNATLSPAAVADIVANNIGRNGDVSLGVGSQLYDRKQEIRAQLGHTSRCVCQRCGQTIDGDQEILTPVPEPSTIALWGLAATAALIVHQRRRASRRRAV